MTLKKRLNIILTMLLLTILIAVAFFAFRMGAEYYSNQAARKATEKALSELLAGRSGVTTTTDIFGDDKKVQILIVGLDTRAGSDESHCDAIQLVTIDKANKSLTITAVPRGTYSPLPIGTANTSSDYYVSNSCALGGLEYGVEQIERILGSTADYVVFAGFSEVIGMLRTLKLPTSDTITWLRHRKGFSIGEPQRAHNHSTFLKSMILRFVPTQIGATDTALHYVLYKFVNTDLSFAEAKQLIAAVSEMKLEDKDITLQMKPHYAGVLEIAYDPDTAGSYVAEIVEPLADYLDPDDYQEFTEADITTAVTKLIADHKDDSDFLAKAVDQQLWYQIHDERKRLLVQYDLLLAYTETLEVAEQQTLLADYVLEMEYLEQTEWAAKGRARIAELLSL